MRAWRKGREKDSGIGQGHEAIVIGHGYRGEKRHGARYGTRTRYKSMGQEYRIRERGKSTGQEHGARARGKGTGPGHGVKALGKRT